MELVPVDHDPFAAPASQPYTGGNLGPLMPSEGPATADPYAQNRGDEQIALARQELAKPAPLPGVGQPLVGDGGQFSAGTPLVNNLLGLDNEHDRVQLWPEKLVRSATTAMGDALAGKIPQWEMDPNTGEFHTSQEMIQRGNDAASLAMAGGVGGTGAGGVALGSGPVRAGAGAAARSEAGPVWHSAVENAIENSQLNAAPGNQWRGMLQNSKGVKPEEMQWLGLDDWLQAKQAAGEKVSKQELQQYVAEHKVDVQDVGKGQAYNEARKAKAKELMAQARALEQSDPNYYLNRSYVNPEHERLVNELQAVREQSKDVATKYFSYQLPGGENYQEHLLTLPPKARFDPSQVRAERVPLSTTQGNVRLFYGDKKIGSFEDNPVLNPATGRYEPKPDQYWTDLMSRRFAGDASVNIPALDSGANFRSGHWSEPNILAHVRTNDRMMSEPGFTVQNMQSGNKSPVFDTQEEAALYQSRLPPTVRTQIVPAERPVKSLHLEEVQSDWHQKGRKQGYTQPPATAENISAPKMLVENSNGHGQHKWEVTDPQGQPAYVWAKTPEEATQEALRYINDYRAKNRGTVPDAPFKTNWHELALKRMIKKAADEGYDRVSWTPGEAQAARYDLSKSIDYLAYNPQSGHLQAYKDGRLVLDQPNIPKEQLADHIGKEAADKVLNAPTAKVKDAYAPSSEYHTLENADLKIGGEGMHEFYDKMLPRSAEKLGKAHGVKVKRGEIWDSLSTKEIDRFTEEHGYPPDGDAKHPVHYFDIPPSMRDAAKEKGMPLFSGGKMLVPVDHDPFAAPAPQQDQGESWSPEAGETKPPAPETPLADGLDFSKLNQPTGEARQSEYKPSERVGNAAAEGLMAAGMAPYTANDLTKRVGNVLQATPLGMISGAADMLYAKHKDDNLGVIEGMAGMIPGAKPAVKAAKAAVKAEVTAARELSELRAAKLDSNPHEQALTVNEILHADTPALPPRSRNVEEIAKELVDRGSSALKKLGVKSGRIEEASPHTDELLSRAMASEVKAALGRGNTASDWYTHKISEAMDIATKLHPQLKNDPHQKMAFTSALAITSQGEAVTSNVRLANQVYEQFKKTGRFPTNVEAKNGPAMNANFEKMNSLLDTMGPKATREFLHKEFTVKDLEQMGFAVGGENKQTKVYGSAILGPKIGQGFYQNLNGNYKPVTMDLWFMRGWGRLTGTLVGKTDLEKPTARLVEAMRAEGMKVPKNSANLAREADELVLKHERDFRANREQYNSGAKTKSELTYAAERYQKNASGINEQPTSGSQRAWMRDRVDRAREILESEGHKVTNADLQAIWWYPEKELYGKLGGRDSDKINVDYATAFRDLAKKK